MKGESVRQEAASGPSGEDSLGVGAYDPTRSISTNDLHPSDFAHNEPEMTWQEAGWGCEHTPYGCDLCPPDPRRFK